MKTLRELAFSHRFKWNIEYCKMEVSWAKITCIFLNCEFCTRRSLCKDLWLFKKRMFGNIYLYFQKHILTQQSIFRCSRVFDRLMITQNNALLYAPTIFIQVIGSNRSFFFLSKIWKPFILTPLLEFRKCGLVLWNLE